MVKADQILSDREVHEQGLDEQGHDHQADDDIFLLEEMIQDEHHVLHDPNQHLDDQEKRVDDPKLQMVPKDHFVAWANHTTMQGKIIQAKNLVDSPRDNFE